MKLYASQRDQKVTEFLEVHSELLDVEKELEQLERKNLQQRETNRQLWAQLHKQQIHERKVAEDEAMVELQKKIQAADDENTQLRHMWQALILESGVNWATSEDLRETMFKLQQPLGILPDSHPS